MTNGPPSSASGDPPCRILDAGDAGLVAEFGSVVDEGLNRRVLALDARLRAAALPGIVETVPTYRSLLVMFDPLAIDRHVVRAALESLSSGPGPDAGAQAAPRRWHVPVAYGGRFGEDLAAVAERHGLTSEEVVRHHIEPEYRVFMIGFLPGFAYLGGLAPVLHTPRRTDPRQRTPAGSVSIGGAQAAVSSIEGPSGWHLLGRTPLRGFDPRRDDPFLFKPGDLVRFHRVPEPEFERLKGLADAGAVTAEVEAAP